MIKGDRLKVVDLQKPHQEKRFQSIMNFMRNRLKFQGASGFVEMIGNDREGYLGAWQVMGNSSNLVGHILAEHMTEEQKRAHNLPDAVYYRPEEDVYYYSSVNLSWSTGLVNSSWKPAKVDIIDEDTEKFPILAVVIPVLVLFFLAICCYAIYSSRKMGGKNGKGDA